MVYSFVRKYSQLIIKIGLIVGFVVFIKNYFPKTSHLLNIPISMSRDQAIEKASLIASENDWGPAEYHSAVLFDQDQSSQFFVELDGNGYQQFNTIIEQNIYMPSTWKVRHFQEHNVHESMIQFKPDGSLYGFLIKIPESELHENITEEEAKIIAEKTAKNQCNIDFNRFELIEKPVDMKPCGRIDRTFTYQLRDYIIGNDGHVRLKIVVSGNYVTEVKNYIDIPESFTRRYTELRSVNTMIARIATSAFCILYILIGSIGVFFVLYRRKNILLCPARKWALLIAMLSCFSFLNMMPVYIFSLYNTAYSFNIFIVKMIMSALINFAGSFIFLSVVFSAAEALTRIAFPSHVQLWSLWNLSVAGSKLVAERIINTYGLTIIWMAFILAIYYILINVFGWWSPADMMANPNVLGCYFPWLTPFANSLSAGFWEECAFRAIPLGGAIIIGRYYRKERVVFLIAFIAQALIFGAAHASYATFPGYFRLVELFLPSCFLGLVYIYWGLASSIIIHWLYDLVLMVIPIFVSHASDVIVSKVIVIILALVPLFVVMYARLKNGKWLLLSNLYYNREIKNNACDLTCEIDNNLSQNVKKYINFSRSRLLIVGSMIASLFVISCIFLVSKQNNISTLTMRENDAASIVENYIVENNIVLPVNYCVMSSVIDERVNDNQYKFIWQVQGEDIYYSLINNYLNGPCWQIRYASFTGSLDDRAHEHLFIVNNNGNIVQHKEILSQGCPGASLSVFEARGIAVNAIKDKYGIELDTLREISSLETKQSARTDWVFTFVDKSISLKHNGEARLEVTICGNHVTNIYKLIFVPETWIREEAKKDSIKSIVMIFMIIICGLFVLIGFIKLFNSVINSLNVFKIIRCSLILFTVFLVNWLNSLHTVSVSFSTAQSWMSQCFQSLLTVATTSFFIALLYSLCLYLLYDFARKEKYFYQFSTPLVYCFMFVSGFGVSALYRIIILYISPSIAPVITYSFMSDFMPLYGVLYSVFIMFLYSSVVLFFSIISIQYITNYGSRYLLLLPFLSTFSFIVLFAQSSLFVNYNQAIIVLIVMSFIGSVFYYFILRYSMIAAMSMIFGYMCGLSVYNLISFITIYNILLVVMWIILLCILHFRCKKYIL